MQHERMQAETETIDSKESLGFFLTKAIANFYQWKGRETA